ncbi:MAG TPA: LysR family transcriptional regulator [Steroidobacteraceae bacterium]|nr:LysR family transcriptional regulator [Steroidobacteraceae bacterium]
MNPKTFDNVNLNLLVIFAVLMRERSVTRASKILMISQPAVSHALKQLRTLFADPLFTRSSTGVNPTKHAQVVHKDLLVSLEAIEAILNRHHPEQRNPEQSSARQQH